MDIDLGEITEVNEENDSKLATKIRPFVQYKKMNPEVRSRNQTMLQFRLPSSHRYVNPTLFEIDDIKKSHRLIKEQ